MPDPAKLRLDVGVGLPMLAVAPGPARALLMVLLTARQADHASIVARHGTSVAAAGLAGAVAAFLDQETLMFDAFMATAQAASSCAVVP